MIALLYYPELEMSRAYSIIHKQIRRMKRHRRDRFSLPIVAAADESSCFPASLLLSLHTQILLYWKMSRMEPGACGLCGDMAEAMEGLWGGAKASRAKARLVIHPKILYQYINISISTQMCRRLYSWIRLSLGIDITNTTSPCTSTHLHRSSSEPYLPHLRKSIFNII